MTPLERAARRILNGFLPGRVNTVDDSGAVQMMQVDHGPQGPSGSLSLHDKIPRLLEWGFFSNPPPGADVAVICVGGDRGNAVVVATGHQKHRQKNTPSGDAGIHDMRGAYLWLTADGPVIDAAGGKVTIQNASDINITGSGTVTVTAPHVIVDSSDIELGGAGGKKVARDGDPVVGGVVQASSAAVTAL